MLYESRIVLDTYPRIETTDIIIVLEALYEKE